MNETPSPTEAPLTLAQTIVAVTMLLLLLFGILTPIGAMVWQAFSPTGVIARGPVGNFVSASSSPGGFFAPTLTSIQTTSGTIIVVGSFSALRGSALVVEQTNKDDDMRLCVIDAPAICATVSGFWAYKLAPVPEAAQVFDFRKHGLSRDSLWRWLYFGTLAIVAAFIAIVIVVNNTRWLDEKASGPA